MLAKCMFLFIITPIIIIILLRLGEEYSREDKETTQQGQNRKLYPENFNTTNNTTVKILNGCQK